MRYLTAAGFGVLTAIATAIRWIVVWVVLPLAVPLFLSRTGAIQSGSVRAGGVLGSGSIFLAALLGFVITVAAALSCVLIVLAAADDWRLPPAHEQILPESIDCWEPALAVAPGGQIFIVAGKRNAPLRSRDFDQRQVIWRSDDRGRTFTDPVPVSADGYSHYDQRIAVDAKGTIYISYMDRDTNAGSRSISRLRLARSRDGGRTFAVDTVSTEHVSDKPELAVSRDGQHLYIVYESSPGPRLVASHDGGKTWEASRVIRESNGLHFWPTSLAVAPDGSVWFAVPSMSGSDIANRKQTPVQLHLFRSRDRGVTWDDFDMGSSPRFVNDCAHDPNCRGKAPDVMVAVDDRNRAFVTYMQGDGPRRPYGLFLRSSADGGRTWSQPQSVTAAPRPQSHDTADHDFPMIATSGSDRLCVVWVDDRRGALDVSARCSIDAARTWGADVLLSDRSDGASYKSVSGFKTFYGHYGGVAIDGSGRLHAVWGAGEPEYRTGAVWYNSIDVAAAVRK
jgi:hypothetical protein